MKLNSNKTHRAMAGVAGGGLGGGTKSTVMLSRLCGNIQQM